MTNEEIQRIFLQECEEGLETAETALIACRAGTHDAETVNSIFRAVHSIKGGAGAFGFTALQAFTHKFETVLQQLRDGEKSIDPPLLDLLFRAFDLLSDHVAAIRGDGAEPDDAALAQELDRAAASDQSADATDAVLGDATAAGGADTSGADDFDFDALLGALDCTEEPAGGWSIAFSPGASALENGGEPTLLLRELASLDPGLTVSIDIGAVPVLDAFDPDASYLAWQIDLTADADRAQIDDLFDFMPDDCRPVIVAATAQPSVASAAPEPAALPDPVQPTVVSPAEQMAEQAPEGAAATDIAAAPSKVAASATVPSIRVDLDKLDRLVDTVGELVITQAMLAQRLSGLGAHADDEMGQLDYLTRELQDCAMALRAQPIRSVFSRVPRIVREVEAATGKRVDLVVEGESTELDKTVIERIGEPLTHMIRNAIDHGLETPEERVAAGKPAQGRVTLSAEHRGGRILIEVADDGRGINREVVLRKAREKGIVASDARLSDEEIDNLIFAPGFSTAASVSNISGRGVGMDVVRQNVAALGGRVSITSHPGAGSTFTLALPLTLAIADGMILAVGDDLLVLPVANVVECLRPGADDVQPFGARMDMLRIRGEFLPILPLADMLGIAGAQRDPTAAVLIIVETETRGHAVLMVDAIRDQRQVVIKSLETHYRAVEGIAGATILGDGRVAMIIDAEALADKARAERAMVQAA